MGRIFGILAGLGLLIALAGTAHAQTRKAYVAGGCFWCVEADFEKVPGVVEVVSGYMGGSSANPTYKSHRGHLEAAEITYDPARISYDRLIALFLRSIDPTDAGGQFCDRGESYTTAIFVSNAAEKRAAETALAEAGKALGARVVTPVREGARFWKAEAYHQDYWKSSEVVLTRAGPKQKKNAYTFYRKACGRDARVRALWGAQAAFAK